MKQRLHACLLNCETSLTASSLKPSGMVPVARPARSETTAPAAMARCARRKCMLVVRAASKARANALHTFALLHPRVSTLFH